MSSQSASAAVVACRISRGTRRRVACTGAARRSGGRSGGLAEKSVVHDKLARARAVVDSARSYLYQSLAEAEQSVQTQPRLSIEQGSPLALAGSHGWSQPTRRSIGKVLLGRESDWPFDYLWAGDAATG